MQLKTKNYCTMHKNCKYFINFYFFTLHVSLSLIRYVPPITSNSPNLPESKNDIIKELKKQESLLTQIHAEISGGFVTKKREEQLWEVQRIITQLKRKLRSFDKKNEKSVEDTLEANTTEATPTSASSEPPIESNVILQKTKSYSDDENSSIRTITIESNTNTETKPSPQDTPNDQDKSERANLGTPTNNNETNILTIDENGFVNHPDYLSLLRYQLENQELIQWKNELQTRITSERAEVVRLKNLLAEIPVSPTTDSILITEDELEKLAAYYLKENALLEQKKEKLARDLFFEHHSLIQMQVEIELQKYNNNKQRQLTAQ